jgi:hypothetical protein
VIKRWDQCINVGGEYIEKLMFSQVGIWHVLRVISIFDLFIDSLHSIHWIVYRKSYITLVPLSSSLMSPTFLTHTFYSSSCRHSSVAFFLPVFLLKQFGYISFKYAVTGEQQGRIFVMLRSV